MRSLARPAALRPGDTIGICTPSFPAHVAFRAKYLHGVAERGAHALRAGDGQVCLVDDERIPCFVEEAA